ncbi:hypothetical protein [Nonomuraea sp. GTA35]|uniref:hypothetical protein n=1 Tax=Nonomuraea sp. GTA35 TaxID=1676746 RepID=UPI0035C18714
MQGEELVPGPGLGAGAHTGHDLQMRRMGEEVPDQAGGRAQRDAAVDGDLARLAGGACGGHQRHGAVRGGAQDALVLAGKGDRHGGSIL